MTFQITLSWTHDFIILIIRSVFFRNSIPPTTTLENLKTKASSAEGNVYVDVGFWGGVIVGNDVSINTKCRDYTATWRLRRAYAPVPLLRGCYTVLVLRTTLLFCGCYAAYNPATLRFNGDYVQLKFLIKACVRQTLYMKRRNP